MGRGTDILVLFVGEDVQSDHVDLGVAVLAGLGGGHFHDFAWTTLFYEKIENIIVKRQKNRKKIGVAMLSGLGGGHFHDFAGTTLVLEKKD